MIVRKLELSQFRNYNRCIAELSQGINWIYGANGQGKTNLVEALYYLCNLESFRTRKTPQLLNEKSAEAVITAQVESKNVQHLIRVNLSNKGRQVILDNSLVRKVSEYTPSFMALALTPEDVNLFRNVPHERRKFFNRIISFNDPAYIKNFKEFSNIISEKNALLKQGDSDQLTLWNSMLARSAIKLMKKRNNFVELINSYLSNVFKGLSGRDEILKLVYKPSLITNNFQESEVLIQLKKNIPRDLQYGFSVIGPHRDEYHLLLDGKKDKDFFSQGEFRITNLSLIMTINHLLFDMYSFSPLMIFDDLFSELDDEVVNSVFKYFLHLNNQIFITSTSEPLNYSPTRQFHVVEGQLF